jgi:hypothetical protein
MSRSVNTSVIAGLMLAVAMAPEAHSAMSISGAGSAIGVRRVLIADAFRGPIPTEAKPITGETRLATMRREGRLPDTFKRGGCRFDLGGDSGAAYYVRTCSAR